MKLAWRNPIALLLMAVAVVVYVGTIPFALEQLAATRDVGAVQPAGTALQIIVGWLTTPLYLVGWAAVIEYLARIARALERPPAGNAQE